LDHTVPPGVSPGVKLLYLGNTSQEFPNAQSEVGAVELVWHRESTCSHMEDAESFHSSVHLIFMGHLLCAGHVPC
jgi:hypothetical protein